LTAGGLHVCEEFPIIELFGDNAWLQGIAAILITFTVASFIFSELCGHIIDALNTAVYKEFTRLGIEIPYAKQDLYIKGLPESFAELNTMKQLSHQNNE
jgi:small-conductance mechanosensitive channel